MKIVILCTLFVTTFGRHLGDDRVSIRDLGPDIEENPQELNIELTTRSGESKVLNLRRRDSLNLDAPVYTTGDHGKVKRLPIRDLDSKAYQDVENGGAFLVKSERNENGQFRRSIRGILDDGDYEILLEPVVEENDASRKRAIDEKVEHTMVRRKIDRRYTDDSLEAPSVSPMIKGSGYDDPVIAARKSGPNIPIDRRADKPLYTIELLIVVDYEAYKRFPSVDKVKEYYAQTVVGADLRYANIKSDFRVTVKLTGYYFLDTASKSAITTEYAIEGTLLYVKPLDAFGKWRKGKLSSLPSHDHAMLITGYDMVNKTGDRYIGGIAWLKTICSAHYSTSLVEDLGNFAIVYLVAHELGHSLGSEHDGYGNTCKMNDSFVMGVNGRTTEATRKNPYHFSPCSIAQFRALINELNQNGTNCLNNTALSADPEITKPPGQVWGLDEQCSWVFGPGAKYLAGDKFDHESICKTFNCTKANDRSQWWHNRGALRGTTCGNKKWCFEGDCVYDDNAPSAPDSCMFGDTTVQLNGMSCAEMVLQELSGCYDYENYCCKSCPAHKLTDAPADCIYGDKKTWCSDLSPGSPMCNANSKDCCKTCAKK